ncbi:MAG: hypothetical protein PHQ40_01090 [Anaerolineaceae bacterium]|nr:hypothetical protein [Anaerolineaceae bacterium]
MKGDFLGRIFIGLPQKKLLLFTGYLLVIILVGVSIYGFFFFINQWPIENTTLAMDWKGLWKGLHHTPPIYGNSTGLRIAPWSLWAIWPIAQLPFRASWATLNLLTLICLIISVPKSMNRKGIWFISILLLVTSFFSMRHLADGNFEGMMIAGLTLLFFGYQKQEPALVALGLLMATAKIQEVWLFIVVFGIVLLRTWKVTQWMKTLAFAAAVAIPAFIFRGIDWIFGMAAISERGSIMDSSLFATSSRLGLSQPLIFLLWTAILSLTVWVALQSNHSFIREKAAMLISASLVLSPYMAGNSFLTLIAIGIIPLFQSNIILGGFLIAGVDLLYFAPAQLLYDWSATYIFGLTILTWLVLLIDLHRKDHIQSKALKGDSNVIAA